MINEPESWYSESVGKEFTEDTLISIYKRYHERMHSSIMRHFNLRNYYTTLLSAFSAIYIGGIIQFFINDIKLCKNSILYWIMAIPPFLIILISLISIFSVTRYYKTFLETVVLVAKIENILGLDSSIKTKRGKPKKLIWEADKTFMIERFIKSRTAYNNSKDFINNMLYKGDNCWAIVIFSSFLTLGVVILILHIVLL